MSFVFSCVSFISFSGMIEATSPFNTVLNRRRVDIIALLQMLDRKVSSTSPLSIMLAEDVFYQVEEVSFYW